MGIFEFLKKKQDKSNEMDFAEKSEINSKEKEIKQEEKFVADLSFVELQSADWVKFAGILKREGVLANSYIKQPSNVEISLDQKNRPKVSLEFKSKTSDSVRNVELYQDVACLYVNGAIEMYPETQRNKDLNILWKDYQERLKYYNYLNTNREECFQKQKAERMIKTADKIKTNLCNLYEKEQAFLEENRNARFDEFCYSTLFEKDERGFSIYVGELPKFIPLEKTEGGHYVSGEPVIPFTPRTLEHCILHMTNGQKIEDAEDLAGFERKCRDLQKYSCFESEDWDRVIAFGKEIVRNQYIASVITNERTK